MAIAMQVPGTFLPQIARLFLRPPSLSGISFFEAYPEAFFRNDGVLIGVAGCGSDGLAREDDQCVH